VEIVTMHRQIAPEDTELDRQVLELLRRRRRVTLLGLADSFPGCSWRQLFAALNRLLNARLVVLAPLGKDYEVALCPSSSNRESLRG
jgi:hypothetical protein